MLEVTLSARFEGDEEQAAKGVAPVWVIRLVANVFPPTELGVLLLLAAPAANASHSADAPVYQSLHARAPQHIPVCS